MIISIIGGGPSGMLLSILVKKNRPDFLVRLFERNDRVGKKLLATGNGRCNYTNVSVLRENFHSDNEEFPMKIINRFNNKDTIELLKALGIYPIAESDGRIFPLSLQGSSVLDFLRLGMDRAGVEVILNEKIDNVKKKNEKFELIGDKKYLSDIVVVATGGMAMPSSGSDGIGYRIAKNFGHNIIEQNPTIVQLESNFKRIKELKGVRIKTKASLYINREFVDSKFDDVLFTDYGLSGPAILDLSRRAILELNKENNVEIGVNLIGISNEEIKDLIKNRVKNLEGLELYKFFIGIINKKLIQSVLNMIQSQYSINIDKVVNEEELVNILTNTLSDFRLNINGYKGFGNAQATTGGVDTREVNEYTLESKIVKGLYFVGEVLDVDGDCGGYNLQWAWSSAYIAANNISEKDR